MAWEFIVDSSGPVVPDSSISVGPAVPGDSSIAVRQQSDHYKHMTHIELEGVRVHNLRGVNLRIPHHAVTVICGVSGSGKSSLAFDTLFAEGQRRYVETFSPQARMFLDQLERPDMDRIEGIPPAIAVRQHRRLTNPLSTIGTRTEILRYLQLLFAELGTQHCPNCDRVVASWTADAVTGELIQKKPSSRAMIGFAVRPELPVAELVSSGFTRGIHGEKSVRLEELPQDEGMPDLLVVIDRVKTTPDSSRRIAEAVQQAFRRNSLCRVLVEAKEGTFELDGISWDLKEFSSTCACAECDIQIPELSQESLSFHSVLGACSKCHGKGSQSTECDESCPACHGERLNAAGRAVRLNEVRLPELLRQECIDVGNWLSEVRQAVSEAQARALATVFRQLEHRLNILIDTGLGYLSLDRTLMTLSGGEARRVVLSAVIGSGMINTLYVLDEPTSGMHPADAEKVTAAVRRLKESGNTVVVVEHDLDVIQTADHVVELGPDAGKDGGDLVFEGTPEEMSQADTHTGRVLQASVAETSAHRIPPKTGSHDSRCWLKIKDVHCHNIQGASVDVPLQMLCAVTGVSGSGKSSLMVHAVYPELRRLLLDETSLHSNRCNITDGTQYLKDVQLLEQNPLHRTNRSIPATYLGAFDEIRKLLAETHEGRKRNCTPGTFSFNSARGGRCERCKGHGFVTIDMQFLADIEAICDNCQGRRFRSDVLEVRYRDRSVDEILSMTAEEAFVFFNGHHRIQRSLNGLRQAGLGYLTLGQPLSTLSGGEAQRLRIAALLAGVPDSAASEKKPNKSGQHNETGTLFILDEPSNGLHAHDSDRLMQCLRQLIQVGHSVVIIEHDPRLIEQCDYQIQLGPGPGLQGGKIVQVG